MGRFDLFEFEDQKWFPEVIRNCITDLLDFSARKLDFYKPVFPIIKKGLEKSEKKVIIDFCSGSSGGILKINEYLKKELIDKEIPSVENVSIVLGYKNTVNLVRHSKTLTWLTIGLIVLGVGMITLAMQQSNLWPFSLC